MKKKNWKKMMFIVLISLLIIVIVVPAIYIVPYYIGVQQMKSQPEKGYHADFFLYTSPKARKQAKAGKPIVILVQPNNSGNSDDPKFHQKDAWWMGFGRYKLANELGVALLVPAFVRPSEDWHIYTHALDKDVFTTDRKDLYRIDLQLLAMVDDAQKVFLDKGFPVQDKFLIQGYSASGMFANRLATLHPQRVLAVATGSPGGWAIAPLMDYKGDTLPYPIGIGDIKILMGKNWDAENYKKMPQLIVMGNKDDNDALDFTDGWDKEHSVVVDSLFGKTPIDRWQHSKELYQQGQANAKFILVEDIGHDRRALQHYTTDFFKKILEKKRSN